MKNLLIRFYTPADWVGRLIAYWLDSAWSHVGIELDGVTYHATFPSVRGEKPPSAQVTQPPRGGTCLIMSVTSQEADVIKAYCQSMIGTHYDVIAILGWIFRAKWMDRPNRVYCFELVYDALASAGIFTSSRRLISGEQLMADCYASGRVLNHAASPRGSTRLRRQTPPVIVPAPQIKQ